MYSITSLMLHVMCVDNFLLEWEQLTTDACMMLKIN